MSQKILIKGAGEQASAVAHRLYQCGFRVAMTEQERPTAVRRRVAFCSALYNGDVIIEGVKGVKKSLADTAFLSAFDWPFIPVFIDPAGSLKNQWQPDVIVDARILKKNLDTTMSDAPLTIALGPGFTAGEDVHVVIETNRGHHLGRMIREGSADKNTGIPGAIGGYTGERVLRAPADGVFTAVRGIGDLINAGDVVGSVCGIHITAGIAGVIRGLCYPGLVVKKGQKMGDIDPRGDVSYCDTISDKARTISGSVLEVVVGFFSGHKGRV
ncbi:MAG: EF2563 family selenium-dependent molybdenum hydroxylase system protein [Deltaproteobacteria bacterium]|nr:EF2563 family selenium-dependent molybdenum hydroxylase system protein [Deltaproteobacteria bacterium]